VFYRAFAAYRQKSDVGIWNTANKNYETKTIHIWSPLVNEPVAVRYAWATSPMGNLKVNGKPWQPLHSFRTDTWDLPETDDPPEPAMSREQSRQQELDSIKYCEHRKMEEAKRAVEILERLKTLGKNDPVAGE
jgi:sialate O-acetylesterase